MPGTVAVKVPSPATTMSAPEIASVYVPGARLVSKVRWSGSVPALSTMYP